uniref:Uncharacterized protein n=1 Tax=Nymphaea colorata TaxID=210225 RepID=A0A5K1GXI9_9MAGN
MFLGSERLAADGLHPHCQAGDDGVAGDVGEADGERTAREFHLAERAQEEHGDHGSGVEEQAH